ncbi:MAG: sulfite exporter TauE/SafE family protein [Candidatus Omnitrophica bacterium]|nr:sulfite exporter TauE/SafE family protein [Candidatus Omnitrophota bacterium]MBU2265796.1 sulfite exporter TauE/SafE family protein [Candidatus Omnitrophota bacterium]
MIFELSLGFIVSLIVVAFFCEYIDSTLGMGYGTTLTPLLLIVGYNPLQIVPVVLISELFSGLLAGFLHHREGNVDLKPKTLDIYIIGRKLKELGCIECYKRGVPKHLKVALLLALCSIVGTVAAVFLAVNLPKLWIKLYIGVLVLAMGVTIIICFNKSFKFSWKKIVGLGLLASFNKGVSGGGYGPVVTSGQILSGVEGKSAVGITSLAEGLTCAVGIITYIFVSHKPLDLRLAPFIIVGAILSVPFSAKSVKKITEKKIKIAIAILTIVLGAFTLIKTVSG